MDGGLHCSLLRLRVRHQRRGRRLSEHHRAVPGGLRRVIHKAQGLEYDSVKIVITDANEDDITHSIFYTAVTRARERLRIFWTPETQQAVLEVSTGARTRKTSLFCPAVAALSTPVA